MVGLQKGDVQTLWNMILFILYCEVFGGLYLSACTKINSLFTH